MRIRVLGSHKLLILLGVADCLCSAWLFGQSERNPAPQDLATIVQKMSDAQTRVREEYRPYVVTRDYKVFGKDPGKPRTEVVAQVEYLPPNIKRYDIKQSSGGMGDSVVRRILDHEVNVTRDPRDAEMSSGNYDFDYLGEDNYNGHPCYVLKSIPKRNDKDLLRATVWVDAQSYRIRKIEGAPLKSPSWWVHEVHLTLLFNDVDGMWLQTAAQATAQVRFTGPYHLVSHDIGMQAESVIALNGKATSLGEYRRQSRSPAVNLGALVAK